jgi:hypothetical protein
LLRITTFRPRVPLHELDAWLRQVMGVYADQPGRIWACVGRRLVGSTHEHALLSVWSSPSAHEQAFAAGPLADIEQVAGERVEDASTERLPVRLCMSFARERPMTILRVFRGRTHRGQREAYLAQARAGVVTDGSRAEGPGALACGLVDQDGFVTASAWPDWSSIEVSTGGDIHRPLVTRNAALIADGGPSHYEILGFVEDPGVRPTPAAGTGTGSSLA